MRNKRTMRTSARLSSLRLFGASLVALGLTAFARPATAATPALTQVVPRGATRGTEMDVVITGQRLEGAQEILFYQPGITVTKIETADPQHVKAHLKVAPDAKLGQYPLRLRTATGVTELSNFYVGPFPLVFEAYEAGAAKAAAAAGKRLPPEKQPSSFENPQKIDLNVTVQGVIEQEQVDYYQVECKKGQRLTAEVEGVRLGELFDPYVAIMDTSRFELAAADDTALLRQDPVASCVIPHDGPYIIAVRESAYGGGPNDYYRLHVGTFPRPLAVYPAGGMAGQDISVRFLGDVVGPIEHKFRVPEMKDKAGADRGGEEIALLAEQDGLTAPSPNWFRVCPFPNVLEAEPNDDIATATPANHELPVAFNGIIEKAGDTDFFKFKASKGQVLDVRVHARDLRSPLDSVLVLYNDKGGAISSNDDSGGPDSYLRFNVPADGEYALSVHDHLKRGGPDFVYRVEVTKVEPSLKLSIPNNGVNTTQERQAIAIPRGNRFGTLIRATRTDFGGELALSAGDLPAGVKMECEHVTAGQDLVPVVFEAAGDAPVSGKLSELTAKTADAKEGQPTVEGKFLQTVDLVTYNNNGSLFSAKVDKVAVAVTDEAPFSIKIVQPKAPIAQSGSMDLKIVAERKPGFAGPINLRMLWDAPGISGGLVTMPGDKSEAVMPLSATAGATPHKWKIAVLGEADVNGALWVSTPLAELEVVPAFLAMKIQRSAAEQGQQAAVLCDIEPRQPFEGKAKVELLGLPSGATAAPAEIGPQDKQVVFNVQTDAKTPAATHATLVCKVTITKDGEPIVENLGQGGVLRVDAPSPAKVAAKPEAKPAEAKPAPKPADAKPLSRLEKLRQEQQQK